MRMTFRSTASWERVKPWSLVLAVLAAVSLTITACSSNSSGTAGGGGANDTISIGNIGTYSGTNSTDFASAQDAMKAWAEWTNAHGGIDGRQVKLYVLDDAGSPSKALTDAKELVQQDHVVAIVGQMSTPSSSWASYVAKAGIPVVGGNASDTEFFQDSNFYPAATTANTSFAAAIKATGSASAKGGFFYCTESPICSQLQPILKQAYSSAGGVLANVSPITGSSPNFTPQCLAAKSAGAQSIYAALPAEVLTSVVGDCAQQKYDPYFVTDLLSITPDIAGQISKVSGVKVLANADDAPYFATNLPAVKTFHDALTKYAPKGLDDKSETENAMSAWAAGQLFRAAVQTSGSKTVSSSSVKAGLYALKKGTTLGGLTPPLSFVKGKPTTVHCIYVAGVDSTGLTMPQGSKMVC